MADDQLAHRSSRGIFVTFGGFASRTLIQMGSVVALSRLLTPADFGLLAMIMAIVGVVDLIRDFGLTGAILARKNIEKADWQGLMWLSLAVGLGLTVLVAACAPLIASFYGEPRLAVLTLVISPTLLINGLLAPIHARVQRELRFAALAIIEVTSMLAGVVLAIVAAWLGWGVWALIVQAGVAQIWRMAALWIASPPSFGKPHIPRGVLSIVRVGSDLLGVQLLNYASRNVDNVLIGNQLGPSVLGQYTRAYSLFLLPMQQLNATIGRVAVPVLSRLQDDHLRYRRYIHGGSRVIGYVAIPIYAILAAIAQPLILLLLGDGWQEAATIFSILALAGIAQSMGNMQGWLYLTLGRTKTQLGYFIVTRPLIILGFFVGLWWNGVRGLALVYGLLSLALLIPGYYYAIRGTHVTARDIIEPMLRPVLITPLCYGTAALTVGAVSSLDTPLQVLLGGLAGIAPLLASAVLPAYRRDYLAIWEYVKKARKGGGKTAQTTASPTESEREEAA
jgi:O-antigen/teichoic acid export membrane protein